MTDAPASSRRLASTVVFGLVVLSVFLLSRSRDFENEAERQFIPGPWGHEAGYRLVPHSPRAYLTRAIGGVEREDGSAWSRQNALTRPLEFSHALSRVFPPKLYATHPEFFPLVEGKRLQPPVEGPAFWNPDLARVDVAKFAAEAARTRFAAHPDEESFALGVNDALIWGESPELLALTAPNKWFRERPDYSPLVFTFMNRVAEDLAKTHPRKLVGALAYYWAENAPPFPLHQNVVPFLTADRAQGYDAHFRAEEFQLQERWAAAAGLPNDPSQTTNNQPQTTNDRSLITNNQSLITNNPSPITPNSPPLRRLGLYDYLYGSGYLVPRIYPHLLAENLRHARQLGFTDYNAEMNPNWGLDGPMPWLTAQLLQDPEQSVAERLDEYYRRYFQETAGPMRQFFERCEQQWMRQSGPAYWLKHFRDESQAILFPSAVCRDLREILEAATRLASSERVKERVGLVSDAFGVTERFVAFAEARDRLSRGVLSEASDWRPLLADLRSMMAARREFVRYTAVLKRTSPLAVFPVNLDDYLKNDPLPAALFAIRERAKSRNELALLDAEFGEHADSLVATIWPAIGDAGAGVEIQRNGTFNGPLQPSRRIAGLDYGLSLPGEWTSRVEPSRFFQSEAVSTGLGRVVRVAGTKDAMLFQWNPTPRGGLHWGTVAVSGRVAPGTAVSLMIGWLDVAQRNIGFRSVRLPAGNWTRPVVLEVAGLAPANATWVGIGLRIQNQSANEWIEAGDFRLRAN